MSLLVVVGFSVPFVPTASQAALPPLLDLTKTVDNSAPEPGEDFTYTIQAFCQEQDCIDMQIQDAFPEELDGFKIQAVQFNSSQAGTPRTVTWNPGGTSTKPATMGVDTELVVDLESELAGGGIGFERGQTYTVLVTLQVPADYPPGQNIDIVNTANVTATNSLPESAQATINVDVEVDINVDVTKTWTPAEQSYNPGDASTIGLGARNTSNVSVETITVQEPKAAADGAASLQASNPFTITDFTGFSDVQIPDSADTVRVDAYIFDGSTWSWQQGTATPATGGLSLPAGVTPADVGGIRVVAEGDFAPGQQISYDLDVEQRPTHRNDDSALSTDTHTVDNTATGAVAREGEDDATDDDSATYTVKPLIPTVEARKNITQQRITAGQNSEATVIATNGNTPVTSMTIQDRGFFTEDITFGGFEDPINWPAAATAATLTYHPLDGSAPYAVSFTEGQVPADPTGPISGFDITWTGPIAPNESGGATFTIQTTEDVTGGEAEITLTNKIDVEVEASNGLKDTADASDDLQVIDPTIDLTLNKRVRPGAAVNPGESVISSLAANAKANGSGVEINEIVVADQWVDDCTGFWNAFSLDSIAPTQVPGGTEMTVEVFDGTDWHAITTYGPEPTATIFQMPAGALASALPGGLTAAQVEGIRFTFANSSGFPSDTTVTPNVVFTARGADNLRDTDCEAPVPNPTVEKVYTNTATADTTGETAGGKTLTDEDEDVDEGTVEYLSGGPGLGDIDKAWDKDFVDAQTGQQAGTNLRWNVDSGFDKVTITDMFVDPSSMPTASSVFDAFDLIAVKQVFSDSDPYSSGWYLKYDTVTAVELFNAETSSWETVPAPDGSWMTAARGFKGYNLNAAEQDRTIGVRIVLEETAADTAARQAAQQVGNAFDPYAPKPNSGVGSGSTDRVFALNWQLRDKTRSDDSFVVEQKNYNLTGADNEGVVDNIVVLQGEGPDPADKFVDTDNDTINIKDHDPLVKVAKSVTPTGDIFTPPAGSPAADYKSATWTIVGNNAAVARASYVRITDPALCTDTELVPCQDDAAVDSPGSVIVPGATADPFVTTGVDYLTNDSAPNPFERFDATKITISASRPAEVDLGETTVWLLRYGSGGYTTTEHTATAVNAMPAGALADVVGFSVTFQGTDPAETGGTITQANNLRIVVDSTLRATYRSSGDDLVLAAGETFDQTNRVYAQSYDPVLRPGMTTGDVDDATTQLTGGIVNVLPTKSVNPATITKPQHDADNDDVTVTLGANQGADPRGTLSPAEVVIEDQAKSPEFWNSFDFTGNVTVTEIPAGANQVQVDLFDGTTWVEGAAQTATSAPVSPALPAVDHADVQGIRLTWSRADGRVFDTSLPASNWKVGATFTANLREEYRDSGDLLEIPSTIDNTQSSHTTRPDGNDSDVKDADATVTVGDGTHELAVNKLTNDGNRSANVGEAVPFDLTLRNTGTGYLTLTELVDKLPEELVFTGDPEPVFTAAADGALSEDVTVTSSPDGRELTFTWPEGGDRMYPGETFKIRLHLELQPLASGQTATNVITATTEQELTRCTNTVNGGGLTGDWADDPHTCGTSDFVGSISGPNMFVVKGVNGSLEGAYRPNTGAECSANLTVQGEDYFRSPCVANSQVGGTDDWALRAVNSGTVDVEELTFFDQLPIAGDQMLVTGSERESAYRPQLTAAPEVHAPAGTIVTFSVTSSDDVCVGAWSTVRSDAEADVCTAQGEVWTDADDSTDWSQVTGLRIHMDFTGTTSGRLRVAQGVAVTYSTINVLENDSDDSGSSRVVPAPDEIAWNQVGLRYRNVGSPSFARLAPNKVGVHLRTGSILVEKKVDGPAAEFAPDEFLVDVVCTVGTGADAEELNLGEHTVVELNSGNDHQQLITGIPVSEQGTVCEVAEQGDIGKFGEVERDGSPTSLDVTVLDTPGATVGAGDVADDQVATVTNTYAFTGMTVQKLVDTASVDVDFGPFSFQLNCVAASGVAVAFDDAGSELLSFNLAADGSWDAPSDRIPTGSTCTLVETGTDGADSFAITGAGVTDNGDGSATIALGAEPAAVAVTNVFESGEFTLTKEVAGAAAAQYGQGPFDFDVVCTYDGQTPYDGSVTLAPGESEVFGPYPVGTVCAVDETDDGGATSSSLDPESGEVTIAAPNAAGELSQVSMTATNTFDFTGLSVAKLVDTQAVDVDFGPFDFTLSCVARNGADVTFDDDGATSVDFEIEADGTWDAPENRIPVGAECTLTETGADGADSITVIGDNVVDNGGGTATITPDTEVAEVEVTNTFESGEFTLTKEVAGKAAAQYGQGPFDFDVVCTYDGQTPYDGSVTLDPGESEVFGPYPVGTQCSVEETEDGGATSTSMSPESGSVTIPAPDAAGQLSQVSLTATNTFDFTGLALTKRVDTQAVDVDFGPFTFEVSCVALNGADVTFGADGSTLVEFQLEADGTWNAPVDTIPVGATCAVAETDADFADHLVFTGDNLVDNGDGSATVTPGTETAEVEVINAYDAGTFTLDKQVDGDGAKRWGTGTFTFDVVCTYLDQTPFDDEVELTAGSSMTFGPYPTGTECAVAETGTAGADNAVLDPVDGKVTIPKADAVEGEGGPQGPTGPGDGTGDDDADAGDADGEPAEDGAAPTQVSMTATNTFDITSLEVEKKVTGNLAAAGANGPFEVALSCTWLVDGERVAFEVPGGAERSLTKANGYEASYDELPASSRCELTETETGGAESTTIVTDVAGEEAEKKGTSVDVALDKTAGPGEATATLTNFFADSDDDDGRDGTLGNVGATFGPWLPGLGLLLLGAGAALVYGRRRRA